MDVKAEKEIISKLSVNELEALIRSIDKTEKYCVILKFTASWCGPCKTIKPTCDKYFKNLPENVILSEIDIDESMDLYMFFKKGRIRVVNGIPAMLAWIPNNDRGYDHWYLPDESVSGGDITGVECFFKLIEEHANNLN